MLLEAEADELGRCDVRVEFKYATKSQAARLFKHFFSLHSKTVSSAPKALPNVDEKLIMELPPTPAATPKIGNHDDDLGDIAENFGKAMPEGKVSVSAIQGYLMRYKRQPERALAGLQSWIDSGYDQAPAKTVKGSDLLDQVATTKIGPETKVKGLGIEHVDSTSP